MLFSLIFIYKKNHGKFCVLLNISTCKKLQIIAHKLAIEGGRYLNIFKNEGICTVCNTGEVEDEEHFLLSCSLYKPLRQVLCSKLVKFNHQCLNLKIILYNHNHYILKMSSNFIEKCLNQRETALS